MLSRFAKYAALVTIAGLASARPLPVLAESVVTISGDQEVQENPFAARKAAKAKSDNGKSGRHKNPFSRSAKPRMMTRVPRTGTSSRWRRPATADSPALPNAPLPAPLSKQDQAARSATIGRDDIWSTDRRTATLPPKPTDLGPSEIQQPSWLLPDARRTAAADGIISLPPPPSPAASVAAIDLDLEPPVSDAAADPFDSFAAGLAKFADEQAPSDQTAAHPTVVAGSTERFPTAAAPAEPHPIETLRTEPLTASFIQPTEGRQPRDLYLAAQQAAGAANSLEELADVVRLCAAGVEGQPRPELAESLHSLAAWAHNRRGELAIDAGQAAAALAEFDAAIDIDPNCWLAIHNRAISRAQAGQFEAAFVDFQAVVDRNPGFAAAYRNRGELLAALDRTEEAVADYSRALAQLTGDADLYDMRGHALHRLGRYDEAIDDLTRAAELAPDQAHIYTHRGNVLAERGDFALALHDLRHALTLDSEQGHAYRSIAWLLATCPDPQIRDARLAVTAAEEAAQRLPPSDPFVLDTLAAAYASAGQYEQAVRWQKEAVAVAPDSFADQFVARRNLYEQGRPFRNGTAHGPTDGTVRPASLESVR